MKRFASPAIFVLCVLSASWAAGLVACGSSVDSSAFDDPGTGADAGGGGGTETGGGTADGGGGAVDTGGGGGGETSPGEDGGPAPDTSPPDTAAPLTLDNVCERLADAVCTKSYEDCCKKEEFGFDPVGCRSAVTAGCGVEVAEVKAGSGTFNPGAFPKCAAAWASLGAACTVPLLDYIEVYAACNQLFPGTVAPGGTCTEDNDCKVPEGSFANCRGDNRCEAIAVAKEGQPCNQGFGTSRTFCDNGLYCSSPSGAGTCIKGKALGASCTQSFECGFGNWCSRPGGASMGTCTAGRGFDEGCSFDSQCASGDCNGGRCTDPNVTVATDEICTGGGG